MCMVDDADRVNILSNVDRVARKEHRCGECGRMIQRGETYKVEAGVIDGRMEVYKTCAHCEEAESKLAAATRERDEATARLNAIIPSCEDWEARERDALRAALDAHNSGCIGACEARAKDCEAYTSRGLQCPECPRDWMVDTEAALAARGEG